MSFKAIWIWLSCFFGFNKRKMERANGQLEKFGIYLDSPGKEHAWIELDQHNTQVTKIKIGPKLAFPQIKQILKFVGQYEKRVIIELNDDPWEKIHDDPMELISAYEDWLVALLNNFQFPANIEFIQLPVVSLYNEESEFSYQFFFDKIQSIMGRVNMLNNHLRFTNPTFNEKRKFNKDSFRGVFCRSLKVKSKTFTLKDGKIVKKNLIGRWMWSLHFYGMIKKFLDLEKKVKGDISFTDFSVQNRVQSIAEIQAVYYIANRIFKKRFHSLIFESQNALRSGDKEIYLALRNLHGKN